MLHVDAFVDKIGAGFADVRALFDNIGTFSLGREGKNREYQQEKNNFSEAA